MSNSRNGQRRFLVGTMKAVVLLMCFALIFALVLTVGVMGGGFGLPVAEAEYSPAVSYLKVNGRTYSSDAEVTAAIQSALHAQNAGSVTVTIDLASTDLQSYSNMSATSGSASNYDWSGRPWDANDGFGAQADTDDADVFSWLNFRIPSVITSFISNSSYSVSARHQAEIWCRRSALTGGTMWGYSFESGTGARTSHSWNTSGATYNQGDGAGDDARVLYADETISNLSSGTTYLYVLMQGNHQGTGWWAVGGGVRATNNVFTFTISLSGTQSDTGAPQATINESGTTVTSTVAADPGSYLNSTNSALYNAIVNNAPNDRGVTINGNTISLINAAVRYDEDGYAKRLTLNVQDYCNDGTAASASSAAYYAGLAGIRVNGGDSDLIGTQYGTSGSANFSYNGGTNNGRITWTVSSARDTGTLVIEFRDNTGDNGVKIQIRDSASNSNYLDLTVVVGGIYGTGGSDLGGVSVNNDDTLSTAAENPFDGLVWNAENLNLNISGAGSGANSLIWYFAAERYDSASAAFGASSPVLSGGMTGYYPFG